jgi:hypothetical protein
MSEDQDKPSPGREFTLEEKFEILMRAASTPENREIFAQEYVRAVLAHQQKPESTFGHRTTMAPYHYDRRASSSPWTAEKDLLSDLAQEVSGIKRTMTDQKGVELMSDIEMAIGAAMHYFVEQTEGLEDLGKKLLGALAKAGYKVGPDDLKVGKNLLTITFEAGPWADRDAIVQVVRNDLGPVKAKVVAQRSRANPDATMVSVAVV